MVCLNNDDRTSLAVCDNFTDDPGQVAVDKLCVVNVALNVILTVDPFPDALDVVICVEIHRTIGHEYIRPVGNHQMCVDKLRTRGLCDRREFFQGKENPVIVMDVLLSQENGPGHQRMQCGCFEKDVFKGIELCGEKRSGWRRDKPVCIAPVEPGCA